MPRKSKAGKPPAAPVNSHPTVYRGADNPQRHIAMMQDPDRWPVWPYLPLKRYAIAAPHQMQTGYLVHATDARFTVFLGLIAFAHPRDDAREVYQSFQDIVDAGWEVD